MTCDVIRQDGEIKRNSREFKAADPENPPLLVIGSETKWKHEKERLAFVGMLGVPSAEEW